MHQMKLRFLQTVRHFDNIFWALLFPIVLSLFFHFAFGKLGTDTWSEIAVALVGETEEISFSDMTSFSDPEAMRDIYEQSSGKMFAAFIRQMDSELLTVTEAEEADALAMLESGEVDGIFYAEDAPHLTVGGSGMNETVLSMLLDTYVKNTQMIKEIAMTHPERLQEALQAMTEDVTYIRETTLSGKTYDTMLEYFFALIAMMCFFGCFSGKQLAEESVANVSATAARRSISPEHKLRAVLTDFLIGTSIQFACAVVFLLFLRFVLRIHIAGSFAGMLLICLLGSMIGIALGMVVGAAARLTEGMKMALLVGIPLFLCYLAGMMYGEMKYIIEAHVPLINRLNPAALISDALYFLNVYEDAHAFALRVLILAAITLVMTAWAVLALRRTKYKTL